MKINTINLPLYYQIQNKNIAKESQATLGCDTVSFSRKISDNPKYERHGGWCELFYKREEIEKLAVQNVPSLKNKTFGLDEYEKLTEKEKDYLRNIIDLPYLKYTDRNNKERTIEKDMQFFLKISYILKNILDEKYPDGWTFVAIGGSCALFAKILEYMGADSVIVPFSKRITSEKNYYKIDFNKYFDDIDFTKDKLQDKKQILYVDYVSSGKTLNLFDNILKSTERKKENDILLNFSDLFEGAINYDEKELLDDWFFNCFQIKSYAPCPNMNDVSMYLKANKLNKNFEWNFTTKLMNFAVIDCITEWKKHGWL